VLDLDLNKLQPWSASQGVKNAQYDIRELANALYNNGKFVVPQVYVGEARKHGFREDLVNKMEKDRKEYDEK
jgi:thymidylate synthase ThyX